MRRSHALSGIFLALGPGTLQAAETQAGPTPDEIIVTGQRQYRPLAEEPASVVVLTAETVETLIGADRLDQALALIPNVQLGSGGEGPTIRGQDSTGALRDLPAFLGGSRPRATLQVDGRPIGYNELAFGAAGLWDIDQIEVFRTPQTTTQGRNSIAGAIFIETADPSWEWQTRARLVAGQAETRQVSAVLSGPLVPGQLAFRVAGDLRRSRTSSHITSTAAGVDYNRDAYEVARLKLLAEPEGIPGLRLLATATHSHSSAPQVEGVRTPFDERRDTSATYGVFRIRVSSATLRADYDFDTKWNLRATATAGDATISRLAPTGFGEARIAGNDRSFETVLTWRADPGLTLLLGVNDAHNDLDQRIDLSAALLGVGTFADRQSALGVFGHGNWQIAPRFEIGAGLRYQRDRQSRHGVLATGTGDPLLLDYRQSYARLLPKLSVTYELRSDVRIGALIQRAYNPGGVTIDAQRRVPDTFGPETLWAYEVFVRVFPREGPLTLSANAFYYDITNAQRTIQREIASPGGIVTIAEIDNAPAATSYGAELQAQWQLSPRLKTTAGVGLLRTRLTRTLSPADPLLGKEFQRAPHVSASVGAVWTPLPALQLSLNTRHNGGYFSDDANTPSRRVGSATVVDIGATWKSGDITLALYARNVFDTFYLTYRFLPNTRLATAGDPRELGGSVSVQF